MRKLMGEKLIAMSCWEKFDLKKFARRSLPGKVWQEKWRASVARCPPNRA
jgi:hypothetical protein